MSDKESRIKHSNTIIRNHMVWSMGAGFIPVPIVDLFAVAAIQLDMIRQLCRVYDVDFKETSGKAIITSLTGTSVARMGSRAIKFIPGVGSFLGGMTLAVLSGASTYAIGEVFKVHFEGGGTFLDFDASRLKRMYDKKFEKGKKMAEKIQEEKKIQKEKIKVAESDPVARIKELGDLKEKGLLTDKEFNQLKKKLIKEKE